MPSIKNINVRSTLYDIAARYDYNGDEIIGTYATSSDISSIESTLSAEIDKKQDVLTAGTNITISSSNVISCDVDTTLFVVVTTLPSSPASGDTNKIHLVPASTTESQNIYVEYLWVNGSWEKLGEKTIDTDLSGYYTSTLVDNLLKDKADISDIPTLSSLGGVGTVNASGTSPLTLSASKSGTTVTISGNVDLSSKQDVLTAGSNITISGSTISATNTTYSNATTSTAGLMSASDKSTLDSISGAVTSVTASGTSPLSLSASISSNKLTISGNVDLSDYAQFDDFYVTNSILYLCS